MQESGYMERRMDVFQKAKQEMACKIAELGECNALRTELQHHLFDLNSSLKQLKARQFELQQQNINIQCQCLQANKQKQQYEEEIELGRQVTQQIEVDVRQQQRQVAIAKSRIDECLNQKEVFEIKIIQKSSQIQSTKKLIEEVQSKLNNLKKFQCAREEVMEKIKQSYQYYIDKEEQIIKCKEKAKEQIQLQQKITLQLQSTIKDKQQQLQQIDSQKIPLERGILNEQQTLDNEKLKKKVLIEKLEILKQRLSQVSQQQLCYQKVLESKKKTAKEIQETRKAKRSAWLSMREKLSLQLEYASRYCQKLAY